MKLESENMGSTTIDSFFFIILFIYFIYIFFLRLANQVWKQLFVFIIIYLLYIYILFLFF